MVLSAALAASVAVTTVSAAPVLHLKLDASIPEADQVLEASPEKIVLEFSQRPELAVSRVNIENAKLGEVTRHEDDETILWVAVEEPLSAGVHTVSWITGSGDGHPIRGEFSFTIRTGR